MLASEFGGDSFPRRRAALDDHLGRDARVIGAGCHSVSSPRMRW
jgi:hypothetical protein